MNPWQRVLNASITINVRNLRGTVATLAAPNTKIRIGVYSDDYLTRNGADPEDRAIASIGGFVIHGVVKDMNGEPVEGACLQIGNHVVFTNDAGEFSIRESKARPQKLEVLIDKCLTGVWKVVHAPAEALPGEPIQIVIEPREPQ